MNHHALTRRQDTISRVRLPSSFVLFPAETLTNFTCSYGWGVLIAAGGGAYYFAKKSINADRAARTAVDRERNSQQVRFREQEMQADLARSSKPSYTPTSISSTARAQNANTAVMGDDTAHPSQEASGLDPAPTRHAPETESQRVAEKSKYEATEVWRSRKGNRFT